MSSLIFELSPQEILLATDTLAVTTGGVPAFFTSKAQYVPHLKTIIAGTGVAGLSTKWSTQVTSRMLLQGIENLDYHTPDGLRSIWKDLRASEPQLQDRTSTVYQLGYCEHDKTMKGFAYRSTSNFESERLEYSLRFKPECSVPEKGGFFDIVAPMMQEQRKLQAEKPENERVHIGGQCVVFILNPNTFAATTLFEFADYQDQMAEALENMSRS